MAQSIHYIQCLHISGWSLVHNLPTCIVLSGPSVMHKTQLILSINGCSAVYQICICHPFGQSVLWVLEILSVTLTWTVLAQYIKTSTSTQPISSIHLADIKHHTRLVLSLWLEIFQTMPWSIHCIQCLYNIGWSLVHNLPTWAAMPGPSISHTTQLILAIVSCLAVYQIVRCCLFSWFPSYSDNAWVDPPACTILLNIQKPALLLGWSGLCIW